MKTDFRRWPAIMTAVAFGLALATPVLAQQKPVAAPRAAAAARPAAPPAALSGTISGRVLERGNPVSYANVVVLGTKQGTATDENGNFITKGVPVGTQQVQVQALGYDKVVQTVQVNAGATATVNFTVGTAQSVKTIEEIEVKAERRIDTKSSSTKQEVSAEPIGVVFAHEVGECVERLHRARRGSNNR